VMQKWECVLGDDGASRSCQQTASGTFASLKECVTKEKCYNN
jgi:hypothetical protein